PEVAQKLGVNILTVRRWIDSGRLTASRIGRPYLISERSLWRLLEPEAGISQEDKK
ncbi:MAG: helix-turn-helix domain-containing protein, partial [Bacteroidota bacterium]